MRTIEREKPQVELGEVVWWYEDGSPDQAPQPAVVTGIGQQALNLNIISPDLHNMRLRDGVLWLGDPRCGTAHMREGGGWDLTPSGRRLREMEKALDLLMDLAPQSETVEA
jgi:hypothetical protein